MPFRVRALFLALFLAALASLASTPASAAPEPREHVVYAGQRLASIAKRYNVSVEALCNANGIRPSDPIQPGQRLLIPGADDHDGSATRRWRDHHAPPTSPAGGAATAASPVRSRPPSRPGGSGSAERRTHVVYAGHTLGKIASRYHVSVEALCSANGITEADPIRPGQVLVIPGQDDGSPASAAVGPGSPAVEPPPQASQPDPSPSPAPPSAPPAPPSTRPRRHVVYAGHTLGKIATRYHVSVEALCTANGIERGEPLKPGQVVLVPGPGDPDGTVAARLRASGAVEVAGSRPRTTRATTLPRPAKGPPSWQAYRKTPWKRGFVTLVGYEETWKGYVIGPNGEVLPAAHQAICRLMGADGDHPRVDRRLVRLLADVSDTFGGRPIRVVSGFRTESYALSSRHRRSQALDFSIPGVPNEALRDYVLTFSSVGVGYYPNSSFVHLDVRDQKTYWVDRSGPGEAPRYVR